MKARTALVIACGFVLGMAVTFPVTTERHGETPPTPVDEPAPSSEPLSLTVDIFHPSPEDGWLLMAPEALARQRPPSDVKTCAQMFSWAIDKGATPTLDIGHSVTIRAERTTHFKLDFEVQQVSAQEERTSSRLVRLGCTSADSKETPPPTGENLLPEISTTPIGGEVDNHITSINEFHLTAGESVQDRFIVDPLGGNGEYSYSVAAKLTIGSADSVTRLVGDHTYRWADDGGGAGYWPEAYTWTLAPEPSYEHCLAGNETDDDEPVCQTEHPA